MISLVYSKLNKSLLKYYNIIVTESYASLHTVKSRHDK